MQSQAPTAQSAQESQKETNNERSDISSEATPSDPESVRADHADDPIDEQPKETLTKAGQFLSKPAIGPPTPRKSKTSAREIRSPPKEPIHPLRTEGLGVAIEENQRNRENRQRTQNPKDKNVGRRQIRQPTQSPRKRDPSAHKKQTRDRGPRARRKSNRDPAQHGGRTDAGTLVPTKTRSADGLTAALLNPAQPGQSGRIPEKYTFSPDVAGHSPTTAVASGRHVLLP